MGVEGGGEVGVEVDGLGGVVVEGQGQFVVGEMFGFFDCDYLVFCDYFPFFDPQISLIDADLNT